MGLGSLFPSVAMVLMYYLGDEKEVLREREDGLRGERVCAGRAQGRRRALFILSGNDFAERESVLVSPRM